MNKVLKKKKQQSKPEKSSRKEIINVKYQN